MAATGVFTTWGGGQSSACRLAVSPGVAGREFGGRGGSYFRQDEFAGVGVVVELFAVAAPIDGNVGLAFGEVRNVPAAERVAEEFLAPRRKHGARPARRLSLSVCLPMPTLC